MRSPRIAPRENGELGSTEMTPTLQPSARATRTNPPHSVDLPTPGGPVRPTRIARPVRGKTDRTIAAPTPDSEREIARASARGSPAASRSTSLRVALHRGPFAGGGRAALQPGLGSLPNAATVRFIRRMSRAATTADATARSPKKVTASAPAPETSAQPAAPRLAAPAASSQPISANSPQPTATNDRRATSEATASAARRGARSTIAST